MDAATAEHLGVRREGAGEEAEAIAQVEARYEIPEALDRCLGNQPDTRSRIATALVHSARDDWQPMKMCVTEARRATIRQRRRGTVSVWVPRLFAGPTISRRSKRKS
jgi:hypothetical protein